MTNKIELEIRKKFVEGFNLPIKILVSPWFEYFIELYEEHYNSKTRWEKFMKDVARFDSPGKWLDHYYKMRNDILQHITESKAYGKLLEDDIKEKYTLPDDIPSEKIYSGKCNGIVFLHVDMRTANFQALYHYDPEIVDSEPTYEQFIKGWDKDGWFLRNSKKTRQQILGRLSPKNQVIIEKWLMVKLHEEILKKYNNCLKLYSLATDELIYRIQVDTDLETVTSGIESLAASELHVRVRSAVFLLNQIQATTEGGESIVGYMKSYITPMGKKPSFHCIPDYYLPQVIRNHKREELEQEDLCFLGPDNQIAKFIYPLKFDR